MSANYQRITFSGAESGWVGAKAGAFNALVDGVDSINIDDDAYFFYDVPEAENALDILIKQGYLGENVGRIPTLVDIAAFTFGGATPTNARWIVVVNGSFWVGRKGGGLHIVAGFNDCIFFHTKEECIEAQDILRKQGLITDSTPIFIFPLAIIVF